MTAEAKSYQVIGTRPIRPDGADKVTGRGTARCALCCCGAVAPSAQRPSVAISRSGCALPGEGHRHGSRSAPVEDKISGWASRINLRYQSTMFWQTGVVLRRVAAIAATSPHVAAEDLD
jgi:hypothetical protein